VHIYGSYRKNKTGVPFFWNTRYISLIIIWINGDVVTFIRQWRQTTQLQETERTEDRQTYYNYCCEEITNCVKKCQKY